MTVEKPIKALLDYLATPNPGPGTVEHMLSKLIDAYPDVPVKLWHDERGFQKLSVRVDETEHVITIQSPTTWPNPISGPIEFPCIPTRTGPCAIAKTTPL